MKKTNGYFTKGRMKILEYLKEHNDRVFTVNDISNYLKEEELSRNSSTIYRYLDELIQDGQVVKQMNPNVGLPAFRYVPEQCHDHLHMQCEKCGKIIHLNCEFMNEIEHHLQKEHGIILECKSSILNGVCYECKSELE